MSTQHTKGLPQLPLEVTMAIQAYGDERADESPTAITHYRATIELIRVWGAALAQAQPLTDEQLRALMNEVIAKSDDESSMMSLMLAGAKAAIVTQAAQPELQRRFDELLKVEHALSESYVRVREIIGAMNPPSLETEALYAYVEDCARNLVAQPVQAQGVPVEPAGYVTAIEEGQALMLPRPSLNTDSLVPVYVRPQQEHDKLDAERLDWLEKQGGITLSRLDGWHGAEPVIYWQIEDADGDYMTEDGAPTLRGVIDAARKAQP